MPQTYHDFDPFRRATDNISAGMVAVNQARNRKAMFDAEMAQRQPLVEAQTASATASARNSNANAAYDEERLRRLVAKGEAFERQQTSLAQAFQDMTAGKMDTPAIQQFTQDLVTLNDGDTSKVASTMRELAQSIHAGKGDARAAGIFQNPASVTNNDADNASLATRDFNLSPGAARYAASGKLVVQNPSAASQQKGDSLPVGVKQSLETLGKEWAIAIAEGDMEGAERIAASVRATREKYATGANSSLTTPAPQAQGGNTPATSGQRVRVKSPSGQIGSIPVEQLDAALQQGFVQVQ